MSTQNGHCNCPKVGQEATSDTRNVSKKVKKKLLPSQVELLEFINCHDAPELVKSLKWVHNTALYHSNLFIEDEEKSVLYDVKLLIEMIEDIAREV